LESNIGKERVWESGTFRTLGTHEPAQGYGTDLFSETVDEEKTKKRTTQRRHDGITLYFISSLNKDVW
jgi:hypothetical protein